jgi:uncharacterized protein involved in exopolysaccharide biosynthesis
MTDGKGITTVADRQTRFQGPSASCGPAGEPEMDLFDYLQVIWRHRWMIAILCVLAMGLTVAFILTLPRRYQAATTLVPPLDLLQKQSSLSGNFGGLGNSMLSSIINTGSITDIYVEVLESREVADSLIDQFDLMHVYERVRGRDDVRKRLARNSRIDATKDGAVKIAITDVDPNRCAAIANAYVEQLDLRNKRLSAGEATSKRVFLETRLKEVEAKLSQIDNILTREAKIQEMLYEMLVQEYEIAKIEEARSMPTIQVLDAAVVPELPMPRGTARKGILAGMIAFVVGTFWSFAREYAATARNRRAALAHGSGTAVSNASGHGNSKEPAKSAPPFTGQGHA